jgi:hypothetical protein
MESELKKCPVPKFKTDGPIVRALFERALAGPPPKKKVERGPVAPKINPDCPLVRAIFERALAGPPKKVKRAPKKGTPAAEVKKG